MMDVVKFVASEYKVGKIELDKYSHDMDASVKLLSEKDLILQNMGKMTKISEKTRGIRVERSFMPKYGQYRSKMLLF